MVSDLRVLGTFPKLFSQVRPHKGQFPKWQPPKCTFKVMLLVLLRRRKLQWAGGRLRLGKTQKEKKIRYLPHFCSDKGLKGIG